jgi:hypothetical protein
MRYLYSDEPSRVQQIEPKNDYDEITRLRLVRLHRPAGVEERLNEIVNEIKLRVRIGAKEIYFVGELLTEAKKIVGHGNFQPWIADTFEFSYDTAKNFMNVYNACLGNPEIVETMKPSVLYQIAAPGFPADLREHIFESAETIGLSQIRNTDVQELLTKYKAKELDLNDNGVKRFFRRNPVQQQPDVAGVVLAEE